MFNQWICIINELRVRMDENFKTNYSSKQNNESQMTLFFKTITFRLFTQRITNIIIYIYI